ncbi:glycoside hydrolase family 6 protein [Streptomyces sp. NPDC093600]|uniref:glycoside hydrolase family 6 protein n=1 Tax=Streptomyces sp. NPDC093600 TaxID=3366047 RepID=UPI003808CD5C
MTFTAPWRRLAAAPALAAALLGTVLIPTASAAPPTPAVYGELVVNGAFTTGIDSWWASADASARATPEGQLRTTVAARSGNAWDTMAGQGGITLRKGATYTLSFDAMASRATQIATSVQLGDAPYTGTLSRTIGVGTAFQHFSWTFTSELDTAAGQVTFLLGNQSALTDITLDNVSLTTSTAREGFYTDPHNNAYTWADAHPGDPRAARIRSSIGDHAAVKWFGGWDADGDPATGIRDEVSAYVGGAAAKGQIPVLVTYNIPGRDCGGPSSGGAGSPEAYKKWIADVALGLAGRPAIVVLEPDAVPMAANEACMNGGLEQRLDALWFANQRLQEQGPFVQTYVDAGNFTWTLGPEGTGAQGIGLKKMAELLNRAGVSMARGFSVNVSNFDSTSVSNDYGRRLAAQLQADFGVTSGWVVDTSRNGNGGYVTPGDPASGHVGFCNPPQRKLGVPSQAGTGGADYLLWIKHPGDSDGDSAECPAGSPAAGVFSPALADALIDGS